MYEELPPEIIQSIHEILGSQDLEGNRNGQKDPLDVLGAEFDVVQVLNAYFPEESSLAHFGEVDQRLQDTQNRLEKEIEELKEELRRNQNPNRMQIIQEMISDLLGQMSRIREKATESEAVVRDITKDIQVLDLAKKNLTTSTITLKRLQMLVSSLTQLEDLVKEKKYKEISRSMGVIKQLSATFKSFMGVRYISQLFKRAQELQGEVRGYIDTDFDAFYFQDPAKPIRPSIITDACLVVDVLGADVRSHLIERYVSLELKEYRRIFRATDEAGQLDNLSRRFAWFRRLQQNHEAEAGRVFPQEWNVAWSLLAKFSEVTRDDVTGLLAKANVGGGLTVAALFQALQTTLEFEVTMAKKFNMPFQEILNSGALSDTAQPPKSISAAFESHLSVFVDAQDKAIADMLAPHRKSLLNARSGFMRSSLDVPANAEKTDEGEEEQPIVVLPSSTELFYFYKQSLEQCAKLSTGKPLLDLGNVQRKWLKVYAEDVLVAGLKKSANTASTIRRSIDTRYDIDQVKRVCLMLNTADYCQTVSAELEEKLKERLQTGFKEKLSFQDEHDLFVNAVSIAINTLIHELELACDPALTVMSRTTWSSTKFVSGQSPYVGEVIKTVENVIETIKPLVEQKKYMRNLFDKVCSLLMAKFTYGLVRSRPLMEVGAEQLLIDLGILKSFLNKMPGEAYQTAAYSRGLAKQTGRIEALLKVIVTPVDPPEGFILNYTLLIGDASFTNFQKILDLKGTPPKEQNSLLDFFLTITSTNSELESTSFLSSLDMDPPSSAISSIANTTPATTLNPITASASASSGASILLSPAAMRKASLPLAVAAGSAAESLFMSLSPPAPGSSGPPTGSSTAESSYTASSIAPSDGGGGVLGGRQQVFSEFKRFVGFGLRKDSPAS